MPEWWPIRPKILVDLNLQKTKVMILGSKRKLKLLEDCDLPQICVDGNIIFYVNSNKHLRVHLTNNLTWDVHVAYIARKVYVALDILKYRRNIISMSTRILLVMAMIILIIDYCSLVLINISKR